MFVQTFEQHLLKCLINIKHRDVSSDNEYYTHVQNLTCEGKYGQMHTIIFKR